MFRDIARSLMCCGIDTPDACGDTSLIHAVKYRNIDAVRRLLVSGADVNKQNNCGNTALFYAVKYDWLDDDYPDVWVNITRLLLQYGADPNINNHDLSRTTAIFYAVGPHTNMAVVRLLFKHGAHTRTHNKNGVNVLLVHALSQPPRSINIELIQMLLERGDDVNARNYRGQTPLMLSIMYSHDIKIIQLLLDHGANVNARSKRGLTVLSYASSFGGIELFDLLVAHGASIPTRAALAAQKCYYI